MSLPSLILRSNADRRLRRGHLWVYSNEVDIQQSPLTAFHPGDPAVVCNHQGKPLGVATVNPHSLICARLLRPGDTRAPDRQLFTQRIEQALALRRQLFPQPYYRLVHGEGDLLPGLVVDRYGDVLVAQLNTAGMERLRAEVLAALVAVTGARGVLWRNDSPARAVEGLTSEVTVAYGEVPETVDLEENGVAFTAPIQRGQKTGWFYDHRDNRAQLARVAAGKRVLDVYSYIGGWGVQLAAAGAREVVAIDSAGDALSQLQANAARNGVGDRVRTLQGQAPALLKELLAAGERFDLVVLDPPAFIKKRKDQRAGEQAYHRINQLGVRLLAPEGILASASCSMHLPAEQLVEIVRGAGRHHSRNLQVWWRGYQGADHPVHPAIVETAYLKAVFARSLNH